MKAISLTALTITAYLILANLLAPNAASTRKPLNLTQSATADPSAIRVEPESAPATGREIAEGSAEQGGQNEITAVNASGVPDASGLPDVASGVPGEADASAVADVPAVTDVPAVADVPATTGYVADTVAAPAVAAPAVAVPAVAVPAVAVPAVAFPTAAAPVVVSAPQTAAVVEEATTQLEAFTASVANGQAGQVVGVYVEGVLALPVVQQPQGQPNYVATENDRVTQFATPKSFGTIGLLAHNYLSGAQFFQLGENQEAVIVYGDGQQQAYRITRIQRYQALDPTNAYSNFIDVNDSAQTVISASSLFSRVYAQPDQLVFQTCIEANGDFSWGRLFVTAERVN